MDCADYCVEWSWGEMQGITVITRETAKIWLFELTWKLQSQQVSLMGGLRETESTGQQLFQVEDVEAAGFLLFGGRGWLWM